MGVRDVGNVKLMARAVEGIEMKDLKSLADDGKKQLGSGVVAIVGVTEDGKAGVVVGVTSDLTSRYNAVELVRVASEALGGKGGGGRPDMAQAGGPDGAKAERGAGGDRKRRWRGRSLLAFPGCCATRQLCAADAGSPVRDGCEHLGATFRCALRDTERQPFFRNTYSAE